MSNEDLPASNPEKPKPRSSHRQDLRKAVTMRELTRKMQPPPREMNDDLANELVAASVVSPPSPTLPSHLPPSFSSSTTLHNCPILNS